MKNEVMKPSHTHAPRFKFREQGWTKDIQRHGNFVYVVYNTRNIRKHCRKYLAVLIVLLTVGTLLSCTTAGNQIADRFLVPVVEWLFDHFENLMYR